MQSFSEKQLKFTFIKSQGTFSQTGTDTVSLEGYRASCTIEKAGGGYYSSMDAQIYGVSQELMNELTSVLYDLNVKDNKATISRNVVQVFAVDKTAGYEALVYQGDIIQAWGNYLDMPNVFLYIQAQVAYSDSILPALPTSYKGSVQVATVIGNIAYQLGYNFKNNGVNQTVNNPYLTNTYTTQMYTLARAANINLIIDEGEVIIYPNLGNRGTETVDISQETGMIGYPSFSAIGVTLSVLFNPLILLGANMNVKSDIPRANGIFVITSLTHYLQSAFPGGQFFTQLLGTNNGLAITSP